MRLTKLKQYLSHLAKNKYGNIMGTQQSGEMPLKITNLVSDSKLILKIRKLVEKIMSKDPRLENENNLLILKNVKMIIEKKDIWEYIS